MPAAFPLCFFASGTLGSGTGERSSPMKSPYAGIALRWFLIMLLGVMAAAAGCSSSDSGGTVATTTSQQAPSAPQAPVPAAAPVAPAAGTAGAAQAPAPAAQPVGDPGAAPREAMQAKIQRVIFGVNVLSQEYSIMRHGSQTQAIQYRPEVRAPGCPGPQHRGNHPGVGHGVVT